VQCIGGVWIVIEILEDTLSLAVRLHIVIARLFEYKSKSPHKTRIIAPQPRVVASREPVRLPSYTALDGHCPSRSSPRARLASISTSIPIFTELPLQTFRTFPVTALTPRLYPIAKLLPSVLPSPSISLVFWGDGAAKLNRHYSYCFRRVENANLLAKSQVDLTKNLRKVREACGKWIVLQGPCEVCKTFFFCLN
jgi:hypothetical protein